MSQSNLNLIDKESKYKIEKIKRKYQELDPFSDDESLLDEENNMKGTKDRIESKRSKNKNTHNNLQSLRELRLIKKFINKENPGTVLSQEQIEYAKKIVEENVNKEPPQEGMTSILKTEVENNIEKEDIENEDTNKKNTQNHPNEICIESSQNLNFTIINNNNDGNEIIHYLGLLNSCVFKIKENNEDLISLEVIMEKNKNEIIKFLINFRKNNKDKDYVEYIPILTTFKFEGDDIMFYEEFHIHKEDLGKMIKRLLNNKYK